jgi:hypothetical protein
MSTQSAEPADAGALGQHVDAVIRETHTLMRVQAANRRVRLLLLLVVVAFVAVITYAFYDMGTNFFHEDNLKALAKAGQERLEKNQDQYMKEVEKLFETSSPVLTAALAEQAKKDLPSFTQASGKELDELRKSLEPKLTKKLDDRYRELLDQNEKILKEEFPQYNDDVLQSRMRDNINKALEKLVQKYYVDEMNHHMDAIIATWDAFPAAEPPGKTAITTEDQLAVELLDYLKYVLAHSSSLPGAP